MSEIISNFLPLWQESIAGVNLPATFLFGTILAFWLLNIIGVLVIIETAILGQKSNLVIEQVDTWECQDSQEPISLSSPPIPVITGYPCHH